MISRLRPRRVVSCLIFAALALSVTATAGSASPPRLPAFGGCSASEPYVRPRDILVACGDGGQWLFGIRWSSRTGTQALGRGTLSQNLCVPYCAVGKRVNFRVSVRLFRPRVCFNGRTEFTRMARRLLGKPRPPVVATTETLAVPFEPGLGAGCP